MPIVLAELQSCACNGRLKRAEERLLAADHRYAFCGALLLHAGEIMPTLASHACTTLRAVAAASQADEAALVTAL
eukprot:361894-Chlamydomonas_euryale.AAC.9